MHNHHDDSLGSPDLLSSPEPPPSPTDKDSSWNNNSSNTATLVDDSIGSPSKKTTCSDDLSDSPIKQNNSQKSRLSNLISSMKQIPGFKRATARQTSKANGNENGTSPRVPPSPTRSLGGDWNHAPLPDKPVGRSRSIGGDSEGGLANSPFNRSLNERHSYRGTTSRYMQAAEAYAQKSRSGRKTPNNNTWASRSRERSGLSSDTFTPRSRTASASPGPMRRTRRESGGSNTNGRNGTVNRPPPSEAPPLPPPLSTQSTPSRKPASKKSPRDLEDLEADDDLILQRMEKILLNYKSKVEDHLAAEGRELPKEIFEDFTTQWVKEASTLNQEIKKEKEGRERSRSRSRQGAGSRTATPSGSGAVGTRTTPTWRKEHRQGQKETKIPVPTFFNSPSTNEPHI